MEKFYQRRIGKNRLPNFSKEHRKKKDTIKVKCVKCGNVFYWHAEWPNTLKKCPSCGTKN